ncbi:MAG TPA: hypothetical protein ENI96_01150 [Sedimenticola thiotaurini]|uniref:Uncharacterized protein n=1 Tax=Sedimenticola thiotaurini TaxID=1543721 RepID=A0A831RIV2_9GAMM|nr:hypothetical protein [Sedimenticola thiotaurini]
MSRQEKKQFRIRISGLEADVAYFDARLALLGETPASPHQAAQIRTYRILEENLSAMLERLRRLQAGTGEPPDAPVRLSPPGG